MLFRDGHPLPHELFPFLGAYKSFQKHAKLDGPELEKLHQLGGILFIQALAICDHAPILEINESPFEGGSHMPDVPLF